MIISGRSKHAIKTALAVTMAYAIALSMDWDKPIWAGFVAACLSVSTTGQGVQKGLMAMVGAICGAIVGFVVLAAFIQQRWLFIGALSVVCATCLYLGLGTIRYRYFWAQFGFMSVLVGVSGWLDPVNAFQTGIERTQEVATGLIVFTIIAVLLWPYDSGQDMERAAVRLVTSLHQLFHAYKAILLGDLGGKSSAGLRAQSALLHGQFGDLLDTALIDSAEVSAKHHGWRRCQALLVELEGILDRWGVCLVDLRHMDLESYLPALPAFQEELDRRFTGIEKMLAGEPPEWQPTALDLGVDKKRVAALSPFDRAALNVACDRLRHLERTTRELLATINDIRGFGPPNDASSSWREPAQILVLDRDRLIEALRIAATAWLVFLAVVYIPGMPGGLSTVATAVIVQASFASPNMPNVNVKLVLVPVLLGAAIAFPIYVFVMPALSEFYQLALVLFSATFVIDYVWHEPRQGIARTVILLLFMTLLNITNQQHYSFILFVNSVLQWFVFVGLLCMAHYVPVSGHPEHVFPILIRRLLNSSAYLLALGWRPTSWLSRWRTRFHLHEVTTLPNKLHAWGRALPPAALGAVTSDQLLALLTTLQALSLRIEALLEARAAPQADAWIQLLRADVRTWCAGVEALFAKLAAAPEAATPAELRARINVMLARIEERIAAVVNETSEAAISEEHNENMVRLLGAYRGVSEVLAAIADRSATIDWHKLHEARF